MNRVTDILDRLQKGERLPLRAQMAFASDSLTIREAPKDGEASIKVHVKALPRTPVENSALGRCVYDLSTCRMPSKLALDDSHGDEIGKWRPELTEFGIEGDGWVVENRANPQHASNRIAYNLRNEIPQEFSIDWRGPFDLAIIAEGESAQVNGLDVAGPCFVIQNWLLRAGAICKAGMYQETLTAAQLNAAGELAPLPGKIATLGSKPAQPKDAPMPDTTPVVPQTASAPATPEPTSAAPAAPVAPVADTKGSEPAPTVSVPQQAGVDKKAILEACLAACSKMTDKCCKVCADFCRTAIGAIGQVNEQEELMEAGYYAASCARVVCEDDTPEAIACCHACMRVCAIVNDLVGWQMCDAKEKKIYVPKAQRPPVPQVAAAPVVEAPKAEPVPQQAAAPKVETPAPVVPAVVEAKVVTPQTAAAPVADPQLAALQQQNAQHVTKIADLEQRLQAMGGGAPPVPVAPGKPAPQLASFEDALKQVKRDHPDWQDHRQYCHARAQFKDVFENEQKKLAEAQKGRGFGRP